MTGRRGVEGSSLGIVSRDYLGQLFPFQPIPHELLVLPAHLAGYVLLQQRFRAGHPLAPSHPPFLPTAKQTASTPLLKPLSRKRPPRGPRDNPRHGMHAGEASPILWQSFLCHLSLSNPFPKARKRANLPLHPSLCPRSSATPRLDQVLLNHLHSRHLRLIGKSLALILRRSLAWTSQPLLTLRTRLTALVESVTRSLKRKNLCHLLTYHSQLQMSHHHRWLFLWRHIRIVALQIRTCYRSRRTSQPHQRRRFRTKRIRSTCRLRCQWPQAMSRTIVLTTRRCTITSRRQSVRKWPSSSRRRRLQCIHPRPRAHCQPRERAP